MSTSELSGDALSRAAAEAMGWTIVKNGHASDPTLIGEMLEWLHVSGFIGLDWSGPGVAGDRRARAYWHPWGHGIDDPDEERVTTFGATPSEALSRCVVDVGQTLSQEPKP